jgi:hypothetical protein
MHRARPACFCVLGFALERIPIYKPTSRREGRLDRTARLDAKRYPRRRDRLRRHEATCVDGPTATGSPRARNQPQGPGASASSERHAPAPRAIAFAISPARADECSVEEAPPPRPRGASRRRASRCSRAGDSSSGRSARATTLRDQVAARITAQHHLLAVAAAIGGGRRVLRLKRIPWRSEVLALLALLFVGLALAVVRHEQEITIVLSYLIKDSAFGDHGKAQGEREKYRLTRILGRPRFAWVISGSQAIGIYGIPVLGAITLVGPLSRRDQPEGTPATEDTPAAETAVEGTREPETAAENTSPTDGQE